MTMLLIEGFDHLDTGNAVVHLQDLWKHSDAASGIVLSTGVTPINRGNSVLLNGNARIRYYLGENLGVSGIASGVVGFHFRTSDLSKSVTNGILQSWGTGVIAEWQLRHSDRGRLEIYRSTTRLQHSSLTLQNNTWYHIEVQYRISNSIPANTFILKVDGHNWLTLDAGTDTQFSPDVTLHYFEWQGQANAERYIDDVYFVSLTGDAPKSSLSSSYVQTLAPTGDGNTIDFVGSDGNKVANYQQVDEVIPDEDTTYNQITSDGRDQYNFQTLSGVITSVHGVGMTSRARSNQTSPTRGWNNFAFVSSVNYDQPSGNITGLSYSYFNSVLGRNPNTGGEWTEDSVNDAQFGVEYTT